MTGAIGDLPDINVWIALSWPAHRHHVQAKAYWAGSAGGRVWFCRHTALGFKRLLGQRAVMGQQVQTSVQCWQSWRTWMQMPEVGLMLEPADLDSHLASLTQQVNGAGAAWPDAYLAAFAVAASLRLISFDRDFSQFPGLNWLHLTEIVH